MPFFLLAGVASARAHDFWLEPERFRISPGDPLEVRLFVGDRLERQAERALEPARTTRFERHDAAGRADLFALPRRGSTPVLLLTQRTAGPVLVVMDRSPAFIEFQPQAFREYLAHEGIRGVEVPDTSRSIRERYARCLKTLLQVGSEPGGSPYASPVGQRLELLLTANPFALQSGDTIGVELLFEGEPLRGHPVTVLVEHPDGEVGSVALRTDSRGRSRFTMPEAGLVVVRTVHLRPCRDCPDADYESWWTSFSFGVGR